jgi:hypothetical protein
MTEIYTRKLKSNGWLEEEINNLMNAYHNGEIDDTYIKENFIDNKEEIKQEDKKIEQKEIVLPKFLDFCEQEIKDNLIKVDFGQDNYDCLQKYADAGTLNQDFLDKLKELTYVQNLKNDLHLEKISASENKKTEHLWQAQDDDNNVFAMYNSKISMHIMLNIFGKEIECLLDTGAMMNIISKNIVDDLKLTSFVDMSKQHKVVGVGENNTCGTIPYIHTFMKDNDNHLFEVPLCFDVMNTKTLSKIILGLPFMTTYQVILDFKTKCLNIGGRTVPFVLKSLI